MFIICSRVNSNDSFNFMVGNEAKDVCRKNPVRLDCSNAKNVPNY